MTVQRKKWKRNWATFNVDSSRPLSLVITSQQFLHFPRNSLLSAKSKKRIIFPLTGRRVAILCRSVQGAHNFAMINGREEAWAERTVKLGPVDRKGRGGRPRRTAEADGREDKVASAGGGLTWGARSLHLGL